VEVIPRYGIPALWVTYYTSTPWSKERSKFAPRTMIGRVGASIPGRNLGTASMAKYCFLAKARGGSVIPLPSTEFDMALWGHSWQSYESADPPFAGRKTSRSHQALCLDADGGTGKTPGQTTEYDAARLSRVQDRLGTFRPPVTTQLTRRSSAPRAPRLGQIAN